MPKDTFRDFQLELERLHAQQEQARRKDKSAALAAIRALMAEYAITPEELGNLLEAATTAAKGAA